MSITKRGSSSNGSVGSINSATSPLVVPAPSRVAGSLLVAAEWFAQANSGTQTASAPANMTKVTTDPAAPSRLGIISVAKVVDPATFNSGIQLDSNSTSSRVAGVVDSWDPDPGYEWDLTTLVVSAGEYSSSSATSDTFPDLGVERDLVLGIVMTNKSPSASLTRHVAAGGGTDTAQALATSGATNGPPNTNSLSDSVVSITRGGTGVNFVALQDGSTPLTQPNMLAFTLGINQIPTGGGGGLPAVTGHGFTSVTQMLQTPGVTWAHRNLGASYPEMTEWGIRTAANLGFGAIEISCQRDSEGTWWGIHDQTPDRVAAQTTYDGQNISSLTTAQVSALTINVGATGAPQPFATLQTLIETLPSDFIFILDPKQAGGTPAYLSAFLDIVDTLLGPTRAIIKFDGAATATRFQAAQARGYKTAAYYYAAPATPTSGAAIAANIPYVDLVGLNYDASVADWKTFRSYGKPTWAHVIPDQAGYDQAVQPYVPAGPGDIPPESGRGADIVQVTSASVTPVGVESWVPPAIDSSTATLADLEVAWLREQSANYGLASLSDLRFAVYGASEHAWFASRSGRSFGTLADHKMAYYKSQTGLSSGSLADLARAFYISQLA